MVRNYLKKIKNKVIENTEYPSLKKNLGNKLF